MNYETFNESMCKLRKAEEEFHKKVQEAFKPIIDEINRIDKEESAAMENYCFGDEIICVNEKCSNYNKKYIYLGRNGRHIIICRLEDDEIQYTNNLANYRKTGKHFTRSNKDE